MNKNELTSSKLSKSSAELSYVGNTCGGRCRNVCCGIFPTMHEFNKASSVLVSGNKPSNSAVLSKEKIETLKY